jgi:hypothetical protein
VKTEAMTVAFGCEAMCENSRQVFGGKPNAGILHLNADAIRCMVFNPDAHISLRSVAGNDRLFRIADQVD